MIIHCTKKMRVKLPDPLAPAATVAEIGLLAQWQHWHANIINLQRQQCVIMVHDATRYTVFLPAMNKQALANLAMHFHDVFINSLMKADIDMALVEKAMTRLGDNVLQFDSNCNRSVQGTMRLMAQQLEWSLKYNGKHINDMAIYSTSAWLSDRPCNIKGQKECVWPIKAMTQLLTDLATANPVTEAANTSVAEPDSSADPD